MRVFGKRLSVVGFNITFEVLDMVLPIQCLVFWTEKHTVSFQRLRPVWMKRVRCI